MSGLTIALALASLLIFPPVFLRSMGSGGVAAVTVAMLGSLTVLPALLVILGRRIDAIRVPLPWRRRCAHDADAGAWARLARSVTRRPLLYLASVLVVLVTAGLPFLGAQFGADRIADEFSNGSEEPIQTYVEGASAFAAAWAGGSHRVDAGCHWGRADYSAGVTTRRSASASRRSSPAILLRSTARCRSLAISCPIVRPARAARRFVCSPRRQVMRLSPR